MSFLAAVSCTVSVDLPEGTERGQNENAFLGGIRLWETKKTFARTKMARDRIRATRMIAVEMPGRGLRTLRISPPDPKSGASANFATLASLIYSYL